MWLSALLPSQARFLLGKLEPGPAGQQEITAAPSYPNASGKHTHATQCPAFLGKRPKTSYAWGFECNDSEKSEYSEAWCKTTRVKVLEELELPRVGRSERPAWLLQPLFMLRILNFRELTFEKIKPLLRKKRRIQQSRELTLIIDSFLLPKILSIMWGCL